MSEFSSDNNIVLERTSTMNASLTGISGRLSVRAAVTNTSIADIIDEVNDNSTSVALGLRAAMRGDVKNIRTLGTEFAEFDAYRSAQNMLISFAPPTHMSV